MGNSNPGGRSSCPYAKGARRVNTGRLQPYSADTFRAPRAYLHRADSSAEVPKTQGQVALEAALAQKGVKVIEPAPGGYLRGCDSDQNPDCFESLMPDNTPIIGYRITNPMTSNSTPFPHAPMLARRLTGADVADCGMDGFCFRNNVPAGVRVNGYVFQKTSL